ncbi:NHL repeat-containing protein [Arthrobacter sp. AD-310]
MRRTVQRRAVTGLIALMALILPTALPASAGEWSRAGVITLDGATSAEGIAAGRGTTFYAGELETGDIYKGDIRDGTATLFIDAPKGRLAAGMKFDAGSGLLFVAGGTTGKAFVYDTRTGEPAGAFALGPGFINDVTLTPDGAWFTNSAAAELYKLTVSRDGTKGWVETLTLTGPAADAEDAFNLNGIAAAKNGRVLIVAHSGNASLYTVDPETGASALIEGVSVPNADGILVRGKTLWAVQNFANQISRFHLSNDLSSGTLEEVIVNDNFQVPTTAALFGNTLAAVNAKFDEPAADLHEVVLVPARTSGHD